MFLKISKVLIQDVFLEKKNLTEVDGATIQRKVSPKKKGWIVKFWKILAIATKRS